ncbi:regulatory protein [Pelomonas saccharophila]|uniref:Regulatory protein RecX n=1 Tax=Roseateles saccharophilus TaxID=304 RepID=A0ABU1YNX8_ROSSA|nr:RecX family transcriptional regulator [Roseateles saccharophilus]MDR7270559.1 regulatory protein [Roseateles saccharophilus]
MATRGPLSLKARAIGLLAQREHSRTELRRKLLRIERQQRERAAAGLAATAAAAAGDAPDATEPHSGAEDDCEAGESTVDALLDSLAAAGYLNESRFVESRLHLRAGRFGTQRIQQELAQHGIKLDAEQQASLRATELERAREVWKRRFGDEPSREPAEQARQTRFLLARGFAPEVVRRLLRA